MTFTDKRVDDGGRLGSGGQYRHHKYIWSKPFGNERHHWELVGANGALHFHATYYADHQTSCGLEVHRIEGDGAPHHINCPLTGGRCWHDGTSLYAEEELWPLIKEYLKTGDHETIFRILEGEADKMLRARKESRS